MSDYSGLRTYRKDDVARLLLATHTASTAARPDRDEYRQGHTAALITICLAVGIEPQAIGLMDSDPLKRMGRDGARVIVIDEPRDRDW
jgi:hypothetical protein